MPTRQGVTFECGCAVCVSRRVALSMCILATRLFCRTAYIEYHGIFYLTLSAHKLKWVLVRTVARTQNRAHGRKTAHTATHTAWSWS